MVIVLKKCDQTVIVVVIIIVTLGVRDLAGPRGSGTTASVVALFKDYLLVANVGDSRVVLCCSSTLMKEKNFDTNPQEYLITNPVQLTVDHTPYDTGERIAVERRGGYILQDGVLRVNGKLAVTRSLGDFTLKDVLTSHPDVTVLRLKPKTANKRAEKTSLNTDKNTGTKILLS